MFWKFSLREKCPNMELFLVRIFLTQIYSVFNSTTEKYGPEITPHLDTFHAVSKQAVTAPNLLVLI